MGLFKDLMGLKKQADDLQQATGTKRPSMREGIQMASQAMTDLNVGVAQSQYLIANGTRTTATVSAIRPTQQLVNYEPVIEYDLEVDVSGTSVSVSVSQPTPPAFVPQTQPGATVNVLVDPQDPNQAMIVFG